MPRNRPGAVTCTKCGVTKTVRPDHVCRGCAGDANKATRFETSCTVCGRTTTSRLGAHPQCRMIEREPDPEDGLSDADGDWRFDPFRRVQIWVPKPPPAPEPEPQWPAVWDDSETAASLRMKALVDAREEAA